VDYSEEEPLDLSINSIIPPESRDLLNNTEPDTITDSDTAELPTTPNSPINTIQPTDNLQDVLDPVPWNPTLTEPSTVVTSDTTNNPSTSTSPLDTLQPSATLQDLLDPVFWNSIMNADITFLSEDLVTPTLPPTTSDAATQTIDYPPIKLKLKRRFSARR
jgi:hypothetical protein